MAESIRKFWPLWLVIPWLMGMLYLQWIEAEATQRMAEAQEAAARPFMNVRSMTYANGNVTVERILNLDEIAFPEGVVADWNVTVVRDNRIPPSCRTQPGDQIDQGWSIYDQFEPTVQTLPFDVWVGHPGCYDTIVDGATYHMHTVWTPRNPALAPATFSMSFTVDRGE